MSEMIFGIYSQSSRLFDAFDYSLLHACCFWYVEANPGTTSGGIGHAANFPKRNVERAIKRLISDGWMEQRFDEKDRRFRRLYLTDMGSEATELCRDDVTEIRQRILAEQGASDNRQS
jgi:DNA-binding MarR family transcriptional regulator